MNWTDFLEKKFEAPLSKVNKNLCRIIEIYENSRLISAQALDNSITQTCVAELFYLNYLNLLNPSELRKDMGLWESLKFSKNLEKFDAEKLVDSHQYLLNENNCLIEDILQKISYDDKIAVPGKNFTVIMPVLNLRNSETDLLTYSSGLLKILEHNLRKRLCAVKTHEEKYGKIPKKNAEFNAVLKSFVARALLHKYVSAIQIGEKKSGCYDVLVSDICDFVMHAIGNEKCSGRFEKAQTFAVKYIAKLG